MGSTLALWAYHRRLSLDAQRIKNQDIARRESLTTPTVSHYSRKPVAARTVSECSTASQPAPTRDRKVSWKTEDSSSEDDDYDEEETTQSKPAESSQKRRFSLDFIFARNKKKKPKVGRKRSQSVAVGHEDENAEVKDHKYPGIHNSDYAALYFY